MASSVTRSYEIVLGAKNSFCTLRAGVSVTEDVPDGADSVAHGAELAARVRAQMIAELAEIAPAAPNGHEVLAAIVEAAAAAVLGDRSSPARVHHPPPPDPSTARAPAPRDEPESAGPLRRPAPPPRAR